MAERTKRIREWFKTKTEELSRRAKILWIVGAVLFVFLIVFLILFLSRTTYVVFNKGLSAEESAELITKLEQIGIEYKVENNGSTILVDEDKISEARVQLTLNGVSASQSLTYDDIKDQIGFTASNETRNKLFLELQKADMVRGLKALSPVKDAQVEIYIKESSTFVNLNEDVSRAAVILTLKKDETLSPEQIEGIMSYVVYSVPGLEKDQVSLIDENGNKLNSDLAKEKEKAVNSQDELKVAIEERLNDSITDFLANVYGEGNVQVKSSVVLDFNSDITEIIEYSPSIPGTTDGMVRSYEKLKEKVKNKTEGGVVGTDSNTTEIPQFPTEDEDGEQEYYVDKTRMNYEINEMKKNLEKAKGQIVDISVAVIINKKALIDETLTDEDKQVLINLVKSAAGSNYTKNVAVMASEFHEEEEVKFEPDTNDIFGVPIWVWIVIAVGIIAIIVIVVVMRKRQKKDTEEIIEEIQTEQEELEEIQLDIEDKSSPKYQIEKFIDSRPEIVAQLIKSWMNDD